MHATHLNNEQPLWQVKQGYQRRTFDYLENGNLILIVNRSRPTLSIIINHLKNIHSNNNDSQSYNHKDSLDNNTHCLFQRFSYSFFTSCNSTTTLLDL